MCAFQFKSQGYILKVFTDHLLARCCFFVVVLFLDLRFTGVNKAHRIYTLMKTDTTISCSLESDKRYEQNMKLGVEVQGMGCRKGVCTNTFI